MIVNFKMNAGSRLWPSSISTWLQRCTTTSRSVPSRFRAVFPLSPQAGRFRRFPTSPLPPGLPHAIDARLTSAADSVLGHSPNIGVLAAPPFRRNGFYLSTSAMASPVSPRRPCRFDKVWRRRGRYLPAVVLLLFPLTLAPGLTYLSACGLTLRIVSRNRTDHNFPPSDSGAITLIFESVASALTVSVL